MLQHFTFLLDTTVTERHEFVKNNEAVFITMLSTIGHEQAAVRDQQNYRLFLQLLTENAIPEQVIHQFIETLSSKDGVLFELGSTKTNAVFQRSFSALFLTALVHADRQLKLLTTEELERITASAIALFTKEQDLRSYVSEEAGWAHSVAHAADLLCAILQHQDYPIRFTSQILQGIQANLWKGHVFQDDEEERFANIVEAILVKKIDEALLIEWFERLYERLEYVAFEQGYHAQWFKARTNLLSMSKTLYFYLKFANRNEKLRSIVSTFVQNWLKMN